MKCKMIIMFLLLLPSLTFGEEAPLPAFSKQPAKFKTRHKIENSEVTDELQVGDITATDLTFWFLFIRTNYHVCSMSGFAKSVNKNTYEYNRADCKLRIMLEADHAIIEDIGGKCSHSDQDENITSCGSRGYIGKTTLIRESH